MNVLLKSVSGFILLVILSIIKLKVDGLQSLPLESLEEELQKSRQESLQNFTQKMVEFILHCHMRAIEPTQEYFPLDYYELPLEARAAINESYVSITDELYVELRKGIRSSGLVVDLEVGIEVVRIVCKKIEKKGKTQSEIFKVILNEHDIPIIKHSAFEFKQWYARISGDPFGTLVNDTKSESDDDSVNATVPIDLDELKEEEKGDQAQKVTPLEKPVEDKIVNEKADANSNKEYAEKHELR